MGSQENQQPLAEVRPSSIDGKGLFASRAIATGARVIEYVGERISKSESLHRCEQGNVYLFAVDEIHDLDGNVPLNPARFLNHGCAANCEAVPDDGRISIVARHDIAPGEELTFNYGYDLVDYREHPCRCGAAECAGYIVAAEFRDHVRRNVWQEMT